MKKTAPLAAALILAFTMGSIGAGYAAETMNGMKMQRTHKVLKVKSEKRHMKKNIKRVAKKSTRSARHRRMMKQ